MKTLCKGTCGEIKYIKYTGRGLCRQCYIKEYVGKNKDKLRQKVKDNYAYWVAKMLKRRGLLKGRTFPGDELALRNKINEIRKSGLSIDHDVPLRGKTVSGLHVSWNLKGLTLIENLQKGNSYV
jgi:hypothetical protein